MRFKKALLTLVPAAALLTVVSGCSSGGSANSSSNSSSSSSSSATTMTIATDDGSPTFQDNFNPFLAANMRKGVAWIYETLYYINSQDGKETPWLATSYKWDTPTQLTFTIRDGVKWNDGQPFTADDVAFTFNMLKKYPALDTQGVWQSLDSVTASGSNVVFKFKQPDSPDFTYINIVPIVPKHVWSKVSDPTTFTNADNPVGTGAYMLDKYSPYQYTMKRNPNYWQADKIQIPELKFPALNGADTVDLNLSKGEYDWTQAYVPDIQKTYVSKDPQNNHYWYAPSDASNIVFNDQKFPFNNVKFRQALEYGINRQELSTKGENGYDTPADPTGLRLPGQDKYLDKSLAAQYPYEYDPQKAAQLLQSMGLKKNSSGQYVGPDGKPIEFTIIVPTGWNDWITDCNLIKDELGKIGITVDVQTPSFTTWMTNIQSGQYGMTFTTGLNLYDPWFYYNLYLNSANAGGNGKKAHGNYENWNDPATDKLLAEYKATTDDAKKTQIIQQLEKTMLTQVPLIPLFYNANWNQYSTKKYEGWPDANNPYATPSFTIPDIEMIMTHLTVKK
ncbi:ABC transporter substrate-binding protein [Alicyclobacillus dauci]|uniref:ABC transporter substrate-binding protein n=1 Tax=Alicyclobacillus dauci TaxID=1475485 RepID=A0ABY6Z346_9BACL|nr:ABC transporter substrate-binding protein [Alicyclobacillus dauci]WAH37179.1 ABC transporter substrate-binding protein [Alicyclobacillus dauci]